jgi:hypothetical protein
MLWSVVRMTVDDHDECSLNTEDLATLSMMSVGKVSQCRRRLIDIGLLKGERRPGPGHNQQLWHLTIPKGQLPVTRGGGYSPKPGFVYLIQCGPYYKIGVSTDVGQRVKQLSTLPPFDLDLVCTIETGDMESLERELHERFADKRKRGEWFELDPEDVDQIREMAGD